MPWQAELDHRGPQIHTPKSIENKSWDHMEKTHGSQLYSNVS